MIGDVKTAIDAILGSLAILKNASGPGRVFELFVMTGVARRLQGLGFEVWLQRSDGSSIKPTDTDRRFYQRGGAPAGVSPASAGPKKASVIGLRRLPSGSAWEIWNGVQFEGRSGAAHEIDVAIVPREVGVELRKTGGLPFGRPRVSIECKDVGAAGNVDEMRAFVARLYDLSILLSHQKYLRFSPPTQAIYPANFGGDVFYGAQGTYWDENRHTLNVIARRGGFATGAAAMARYYAVEPHAQIVAGSTAAKDLMDAVALWIAATVP